MQYTPQKLEYGIGTIYAGFPSSLGFGVGRQPYSNFLASTEGCSAVLSFRVEYRGVESRRAE